MQSIYKKHVFFIAVGMLAINDHFLKYYFPGWITGKLSDFSGIIAFVLFLEMFFPKHSSFPYVIAGLVFIYWKSNFSQPLIDSFNHLLKDEILFRTPDLTDLIALMALPVLYLCTKGISGIKFLNNVSYYSVIGISFIVFCATTVKPMKSLAIHQSYRVNQPADSILQTWIDRSDTTQTVITSDTLNNPEYKLVKIQKFFPQSNTKDTTKQISGVDYVAIVYLERRGKDDDKTKIIFESVDCLFCGISKNAAREWFMKDFITPIEK